MFKHTTSPVTPTNNSRRSEDERRRDSDSLHSDPFVVEDHSHEHHKKNELSLMLPRQLSTTVTGGSDPSFSLPAGSSARHPEGDMMLFSKAEYSRRQDDELVDEAEPQFPSIVVDEAELQPQPVKNIKVKIIGSENPPLEYDPHSKKFIGGDNAKSENVDSKTTEEIIPSTSIRANSAEQLSSTTRQEKVPPNSGLCCC